MGEKEKFYSVILDEGTSVRVLVVKTKDELKKIPV